MSGKEKKTRLHVVKTHFPVWTFLEVAVSTPGDTQQSLLPLHTTCQCREKKNVQTCAQRMGGGRGGVREGGRVYHEESVGCSGDREHETESDCWRICVHLNPERKGDQFNCFVVVVFFLSVRPQQYPLCPPPPNPTGSAPDPTELQTGGSWERVGEWREGGAWHPRRENISSGFVSMRAVLICDLTRTQASTLTWPWCYHRENSHPDGLQRLNVARRWKSGVAGAVPMFGAARLLLRSTVLRQWVVPWRRSRTATLKRDILRPRGESVGADNKQKEEQWGFWGGGRGGRFLWNVSVQHVEQRIATAMKSYNKNNMFSINSALLTWKKKYLYNHHQEQNLRLGSLSKLWGLF